ncbi:hypothetical protein IWQ61_005890 [Dispira simplex]|nr:hypothetical protein IWQ61_005890 [Dispira simplex]
MSPPPQYKHDQEDEQSFTCIGTEFTELSNQPNRKRQRTTPDRPLVTTYRPTWQQEARDSQGRRRFHGAFTGGFTAGYNNTVGSKEGFQPRQFYSTRNQRFGGQYETSSPLGTISPSEQRPLVQRVEDFMDDEDLADRAQRSTTSQININSTRLKFNTEDNPDREYLDDDAGPTYRNTAVDSSHRTLEQPSRTIPWDSSLLWTRWDNGPPDNYHRDSTTSVATLLAPRLLQDFASTPQPSLFTTLGQRLLAKVGWISNTVGNQVNTTVKNIMSSNQPESTRHGLGFQHHTLQQLVRPPSRITYTRSPARQAQKPKVVVDKSHESSHLAQSGVPGRNSKVNKSRPFVQKFRLSIVDNDEDESGDHSPITTRVSFVQAASSTTIHSPRPSPETRSITSQTGSHSSPLTRSPLSNSNVFQITHRRVQRRCHDNRIPLVGFHLVEETLIYPPLVVGVTLSKEAIPDQFNPGKEVATRFGSAQLLNRHRSGGKSPMSLQSTNDNEPLEYLLKRERANLARFARIKQQSTLSSTATTSTVAARLQSRTRASGECIDIDNKVTTVDTKTTNPSSLLTGFVSSQASSLNNDLSGKSITTVTSPETKPVPSATITSGQLNPWLHTAQEAAALGFYGPLTRTTKEFRPHRLLCKRFRLAVPVPTTQSHATDTHSPSTTRWDQRPGVSSTSTQHHHSRVATESTLHDNTNASPDTHNITLEKPSLALLKSIFT